MIVARDIDYARQYARAAEMRLLAAKALAASQYQGRFNIEAVYLAGYSVECSLKVTLLARTPRKRHRLLLNDVARGQRGHSYEYLLGRLRDLKWYPTDEFSSRIRAMSWSTELRYAVRWENRGLTPDQFLQSAEWIYNRVRK